MRATGVLMRSAMHGETKDRERLRSLRRRCGARGFTFLEVMLALLLLSGAVFVVAWSITDGLRGIQATKAGLLAKTAAISEHERLREASFSSVVNRDFTADLPEELRQAAPAVTAKTDVCFYDPATGRCGGTETNIKQITVRVALDPAREYRMVGILTNWTSRLAVVGLDAYVPG